MPHQCIGLPKQLKILIIIKNFLLNGPVLKLLCERYLCKPISPPTLPNINQPTSDNHNQFGLAYTNQTINIM